MHYEEDRGDAVFGFLKVGYNVGAKVTKMLGNEYVMRVMELSRKAVNEAHLYKGFIRFDELRGGVLFGKIEPKCDVIPLLTEHFKNRFPGEDWIIYDTKRKKSAVHRHDSEVILVEGRDIEVVTEGLQKDDEYRDLWKVFFDTIGIDERYNPKCQQTNLPQWYRKYMTEMK